MSEETRIIDTEEIIDNTPSQDINNDTDTEVVIPSDAKNEENSVITRANVYLASEDPSTEDSEEEINWDINEDRVRVRSDAVINNYQRISATYGYAIFIENTALKLELGHVFLSGKRLFGIKNSFLELTLTDLEFAWDVIDEEDFDYESTLVLKITNGAEFTGSFNKFNDYKVGNISVEIDNSSRWYLTADSYLDRFVIDDVSRIDLNGHYIYYREKDAEGKYYWQKWVQYPPEMISDDTGYDSYGVPKTKVLQVIKYEDLLPPNERRKSYIYFVYDKMQLYFYQSLYTDPFCIIEQLPKYPVENMLYITTEGKMYTYYSAHRTFIGEVEKNTEDIPDPMQIALIKQAGTVFFMNAESRYLDMQSRTIQLPFQNGNYILSLSLGADLRIDEHTVIKYNPNQEQFYIAGQDYQFEDKLNNVGKFDGYVTETTETFMDGYTFRTDVSVSDKANNGLEIAETGGLYVDVSDLASQDKYVGIVQAFNTYKTIIDRYMDELVEAVNECTGEVTADIINNKIIQALNEYEGTITQAMADYDELHDIIIDIEDRLVAGVRAALEDDRAEIYNLINQARWGYFNGEEGYVPTSSSLPDYSLTWDSSTLSSILNWFRKYVKFYRRTYGDYGGSIDLYGLKEKEHWLQERIFAYDLPTLGDVNRDGYYYYISRDQVTPTQFPEVGEEGPVYFIINIVGDNRIYQVLKWINNQYEIIYDGSELTS